MARSATGTVYWYKDHWAFKLTLSDGRRSKPVHLPPSVGEEEARGLAKRTSALEREEAAKTKGKPGAPLDAADAWAVRWFEDRRSRGQTSVRQDEGRWRKWISPRIGPLSMQTIDAEALEKLVADLDTAVRNDQIRSKTAALVWGVVTSAFSEACESKVPELRVRPRNANPTEHVRGPDPGDERVSTWLYPVEMMRLLSCDRVSPRWRRLVAVQAYTYLRPGELEALRCDAVDLVADRLMIYQAADYSKKRGAVKKTKTKLVRSVPIEPAIRPLVEVMLEEARAEGRDLLVQMPPVSDLAESFRMYLRRAGCERPELYADDASRRPIRWRDLRSTGITWRALRGDSHLAIQEAAGHERFDTTQGYIRAASTVGLGVGAPFPSLPPELLQSSRIVTGGGSGGETPEENGRPQRDSNPTERVREVADEHDPLISSPFGLLRYSDATAVLGAETIAETIEPAGAPPAGLRAAAHDAARAYLEAYDRGDMGRAREAARDMAELARFGGERRRGAPRYVTDPRTGRTQTVSAWARELGRTSQGLTARLDTMPVERALVPAKGKAA